MKKLLSIALCICLTLAAVFTAVPSFAKAEDATDAVSTAAQELLDNFNKDVYIKNTLFQADFSSVTTGDENKGNFHGSANQLQRKTIYTPGRLYMSNDDGNVNGGYKNVGSDMVRFHIVDGVEVPDYTVKGKQIETFFTNLDTFTGLVWTEVEGEAGHYRTAYTQAWRDFVAPMWDPKTEVVTFTHVIMHATDTVLYLKLYGETATIENTLFSVAEITLPEEVKEETVTTTNTETVTTTIQNYANENNWANGTAYPEVSLNKGDITITASGTDANTSKYYTSGYEWRMYQTGSPSIVVTAGENCTISTVKITYNISNTGILKNSGTNVTSGTVVQVNADTITFGVGNTGTKTNGQVKITAIEVVYTKTTTETIISGSTCEHSYSTSNTATCTEAGVVKTICNKCGYTTEEVAEAKGHSYVNDTCTVCGEIKPAEWHYVTTIKVGDVVILTSVGGGNAYTNISTTSTTYGLYTTDKNTATELTVVQGSTAGSFAFMTADGKYLSWSSDNSLTTVSTVSASSSWTVEIDPETGNAVVANVGTTARILQWNAGSPRFACYTGSQQDVQFWALG